MIFYSILGLYLATCIIGALVSNYRDQKYGRSDFRFYGPEKVEGRPAIVVVREKEAA